MYVNITLLYVKFRVAWNCPVSSEFGICHCDGRLTVPTWINNTQRNWFSIVLGGKMHPKEENHRNVIKWKWKRKDCFWFSGGAPVFALSWNVFSWILAQTLQPSGAEASVSCYIPTQDSTVGSNPLTESFASPVHSPSALFYTWICLRQPGKFIYLYILH